MESVLDEILFLSANGRMICGVKDKDIQNLVIPQGVEVIYNGAFKRCFSLQSIVVPNSVTTIGKYAFLGCFSLQDIDIPSSVVSFGDGVFASCI